jgi:hypothetical protein
MMKVVFAVLFCLSVLGAPEAETENGVLILTESNFDAEIEKHDGLLVMFYAPWW